MDIRTGGERGLPRIHDSLSEDLDGPTRRVTSSMEWMMMSWPIRGPANSSQTICLVATAYPQTAVYGGEGDSNVESSFVCKVP